MNYKIPIKGDGIGPEIVDSAVAILIKYTQVWPYI